MGTSGHPSLVEALRDLALGFGHDTALVSEHRDHAAIEIDVADRATRGASDPRRFPLPLSLVTLLRRDPVDGWIVLDQKYKFITILDARTGGKIRTIDGPTSYPLTANGRVVYKAGNAVISERAR